jgi:hypothetical protein
LAAGFGGFWRGERLLQQGQRLWRAQRGAQGRGGRSRSRLAPGGIAGAILLLFTIGTRLLAAPGSLAGQRRRLGRQVFAACFGHFRAAQAACAPRLAAGRPDELSAPGCGPGQAGGRSGMFPRMSFRHQLTLLAKAAQPGCGQGMRGVPVATGLTRHRPKMRRGKRIAPENRI